MDSTDTKRALLNSLSMIDGRNWESPEKNNRAAVLVQQIRIALAQNNVNQITRLAKEAEHFSSPLFTLFERIERLTRDHTSRKWVKPQDTEAWGKLMDRTRIIVARRDKHEVVEISRRILTFLQSRNGHDLARPIDEALGFAKAK